jgi:hypothetical protein
MGLLDALKTAQSTNETVNISPNQLLGVDSQAITPSSPGEFGIHRTAPVLGKARSFTQQEANKIKELAERRKIESKATEKAINGLMQIKNADTKEQEVYNTYRVHEARKTYKQVASNAEAGNKIAGLASGYAHLHESVRHRLELENQKKQAISGKASEFSNLW